MSERRPRRRQVLGWVAAGCFAGATAGPALAAGPPARPAAASGPTGLSAHATTLVEQSTGQSLYGYRQAQELPIASTTKLMTALLTIEHARLGDVFAEPNYYPSPVDSQVGLRPGERMSVHDLLLALLLPSADDAAQDLAFNVGRRSVGRFIGMMNARARSLGLTHTHYSTPIGLDTPGNYSSASDLVKLASFLLINHPFFAHAVASPGALLRTGDHKRSVANRNTLVGRIRWINGVKTGHTLGAGYVLVGSGTRHGMTLVSVVLGTPSEASRNADTLTLLDYGFANFRIAKPVLGDKVLARVRVRDRPGVRADLISARSFASVLARGSRLRTQLELPRELAGPLRRHAIVGSVLVLLGRRTLARIPLLLSRRLQAVSPLTRAAHSLTTPLALGLIALALGVVAALSARHRARTRGHPPHLAAAAGGRAQ